MTRTLDWLRAAVLEDTDKCILWPFSSVGKPNRITRYGQVRYEGRIRKAHHVALILVGREVPHPPLQARHTCNQGLCVNTKHLVEGTHAENTADRLGHSSSLTAEDIRAIRANVNGETQQVLAERYGVTRPAISLIKTRRRWGHIT